jgi:hypothetical protein
MRTLMPQDRTWLRATHFRLGDDAGRFESSARASVFIAVCYLSLFSCCFHLYANSLVTPTTGAAFVQPAAQSTSTVSLGLQSSHLVFGDSRELQRTTTTQAAFVGGGAGGRAAQPMQSTAWLKGTHFQVRFGLLFCPCSVLCSVGM